MLSVPPSRKCHVFAETKSMNSFGKGSTHPSEMVELRDDPTGARVLQLTQAPTINHNLYFLTSSLTPDERTLVFASYRSGVAEFYRLGFPDGPIIQLTEGPGVHGYSGIFSSDGRRLYYTQGGAVRWVELDSLAEGTLAEFAGGQLGECSLSADGRWLVTAMKRDGRSHLVVTATDGSGGEAIFACARTIIHPQFHPVDPELMAYSQDPAPRMWTIRRDGSANTCLYEHDNDEFLVHETFLGRGEEMIVVRWPYELRAFHLGRREFRTVAAFNAWHICSDRAGRYVLCDTVHPDRGLQLVDVVTGTQRTLCSPRSSCQGSQWHKDRYALAEDWQAAASAERQQSLSWMEMKTDTVYGPQWTHPHPSFSPTERWVVYCSDVTGYPQVYAVALDEG
jgi:oligogalacturonide lyase